MVEIKDFVIWLKHLHGDPSLKVRIDGLAAGELIELSVDGEAGVWEKMSDGADGRPTPGIKPFGRAKEHWHSLYAARRGDVVSIQIAA